MKIAIVTTLFAFVASSASAFVPSSNSRSFGVRASSPLQAKYKSMDEILAKFPENLPILINFYDAATEADIKNDIFRAKALLKDRCTVCSIKQQDYPEIAKLWDCDKKSPSMILFKDGSPVLRLYETTFYGDILSKVSVHCPPPDDE
jgi:hypothetical protein